MWHKPCRTFNPWCLCIKTRCLYPLKLRAWIPFTYISWFTGLIFYNNHVYLPWREIPAVLKGHIIQWLLSKFRYKISHPVISPLHTVVYCTTSVSPLLKQEIHWSCIQSSIYSINICGRKNEQRLSFCIRDDIRPQSSYIHSKYHLNLIWTHFPHHWPFV